MADDEELNQKEDKSPLAKELEQLEEVDYGRNLCNPTQAPPEQYHHR